MLPLPVTTETVLASPRHHRRHHHHHKSGCPYHDEAVLTALQPSLILTNALTSAQHSTSFHPATATLRPQATQQLMMSTPGPSCEILKSTGYGWHQRVCCGRQNLPVPLLLIDYLRLVSSQPSSSLLDVVSFTASPRRCQIESPLPTFTSSLPPQAYQLLGRSLSGHGLLSQLLSTTRSPLRTRPSSSAARSSR
ncbi:hypothetical protein BC827DRAFT_129075 [Russula dissimulans]|nr:hypothetical protein BC827DRAFT_129075 [Russula dissimulans]